MRCQFCLRDVENEDTREIIDGETLATISVCEDCAEMYYQDELTQDELQKNIDEVIDNQIGELQFARIPN